MPGIKNMSIRIDDSEILTILKAIRRELNSPLSNAQIKHYYFLGLLETGSMVFKSDPDAECLFHFMIKYGYRL